MVLAFSSSRVTGLERTFRYIPYGESAPSGPVTITCDGRVPGSTLEITHWTGNETPDSLYADTSTEMALKLAKKQNDYLDFSNAVVLNNHYDTDGVCSVWSCLEPKLALEYEKLLVEAAEAGDFGEWNSDEGLKLDLVISDFWSSDEGKAYETILAEMPSLLKDMKESGGTKYTEHWHSGYQNALSDWEDICKGSVQLRRATDNIVIVEEATPSARVSPYALHRGLHEMGLWADTIRILRVNHLDKESALNSKYKYCYEKIGHGWVKKLVDRHLVPDVDIESLVKELNENYSEQDSSWVSGGPSGLVAICQTPTSGISVVAEDVASQLQQLDSGLS